MKESVAKLKKLRGRMQEVAREDSEDIYGKGSLYGMYGNLMKVCYYQDMRLAFHAGYP